MGAFGERVPCAWINDHFGFDAPQLQSSVPSASVVQGSTGILFAALGLGRYGAPLGNRADKSAGAAVGYQWFLDEDHRKQLIVEFGGRTRTDNENEGTLALGPRYQQALGQHFVVQADLFGSAQEGRDVGWGSRLELRVEF